MDPLTPNIWQMQVRNDVPALQAALRHPDPEIRRKAAVALRALDAPAALPALATALAIEADAPARASLLAAVQHFTPPDKLLPLLISQHNVEALIDLLYAGPAPAMHAVIEALVKLGDRSAVESLIIVFHTADQVPDDVRYAAANALIALQSAPAIVTPLLALSAQPASEAHGMAVATLNNLSHEPEAKREMLEADGADTFISLTAGPATWLRSQVRREHQQIP